MTGVQPRLPGGVLLGSKLLATGLLILILDLLLLLGVFLREVRSWPEFLPTARRPGRTRQGGASPQLHDSCSVRSIIKATCTVPAERWRRLRRPVAGATRRTYSYPPKKQYGCMVDLCVGGRQFSITLELISAPIRSLVPSQHAGPAALPLQVRISELVPHWYTRG